MEHFPEVHFHSGLSLLKTWFKSDLMQKGFAPQPAYPILLYGDLTSVDIIIFFILFLLVNLSLSHGFFFFLSIL